MATQLYETHRISGFSSYQTPFSPSLRRFMSESRECQTLFANCEGACERRVAEEGNFESIKTFIYNSMYSRRGKDFSQEWRLEKIEEVDSIYRKIIDVSSCYGCSREIHYSAVWVHYFPYISKELRGFPVFKIYTNRSSNMAVFLDPKKKTYESWDSFLETADFPEAFLCVPRHGQYVFDVDEQKLDLEFVSFRKSSEWDSDIYSPLLNLRPFCQSVVKPWLEEMGTWAFKLKEKISAVATFLWNCLKGRAGQAFLFGVSIVKYIINRTPENLTDIKNCSGMFFGSFAVGNLSNEIESSTSSFGPYAGVSSTPDSSELLDLMRSPKKNWRRILELIVDGVVKYGPRVLFNLETLQTPSPVLAILSFILMGLKAYLNYSKREGSNPSGMEGSNLPEIGGSNLAAICDVSGVPSRAKAAGGVGSSSESCHNSTGSRLLQPATWSAAGGVEGERRAKCMSAAMVVPVLKTLERKVVNNVEDVVPTLSSFESLPSHACVTIQDVGEFQIVAMLNPSLPELVKDLEYLLGTKICVKQQRSYWFDVKDASGKIVGNLGFPLTNVAIGLLRTDKIRRRPAIEILEKE